MSKLSEEYLKIIKDIEEHISDKEERKYVIKKMSELSSLYIVSSPFSVTLIIPSPSAR